MSHNFPLGLRHLRTTKTTRTIIAKLKTNEAMTRYKQNFELLLEQCTPTFSRSIGKLFNSTLRLVKLNYKYPVLK